jgi:hypothetical protein
MRISHIRRLERPPNMAANNTAYRVAATATPLAAFAMISATAFGWET